MTAEIILRGGIRDAALSTAAAGALAIIWGIQAWTEFARCYSASNFTLKACLRKQRKSVAITSEVCKDKVPHEQRAAIELAGWGNKVVDIH
jgi:hypothetical protein